MQNKELTNIDLFSSLDFAQKMSILFSMYYIPESSLTTSFEWHSIQFRFNSAKILNLKIAVQANLIWLKTWHCWVVALFIFTVLLRSNSIQQFEVSLGYLQTFISILPTGSPISKKYILQVEYNHFLMASGLNTKGFMWPIIFTICVVKYSVASCHFSF